MTETKGAAIFKVLADQTNKLENVKKKITSKKLAVFGDVQNRNIVRSIAVKDATKDVKFQDVKPRVDTRWRKLQNQKAAEAENIEKENAKIAKTKTTKSLRAQNKLQVRQDYDKCDKIKPSAPKVTRTVSVLQSTKQLIKKLENQCKLNTERTTQQQLTSSAVENIDAKDVGNILLLPEYVNDIYDYFYQLETEQPIRADYLKMQPEISPRMRSVLIDWLNEAHVQLHLTVETFHMTVGMIDRYLQMATNNTARSELQLVGVTAMFIASKYEELFPPPLEHFCYITDDAYNKQQILDMELKMLKSLDFNLSRPLPLFFLRRFSKAAKAESHQHSAAKYFLELATIEYDLAHCKPSKLAAASLFLSLNLFDADANKNKNFNAELWTPTLSYYSRYTSAQLQSLVRKIALAVENAADGNLSAVYRKYQVTKLQNISLSPNLYGDQLTFIINDKSQIC